MINPRLYTLDISADNLMEFTKLGRILVPLNFTHGNIYENEHALPQLPMPSLEAISKLASADADGRKELVVDLVRRRNYVLHSLAQAMDAVEM